MRTDELSALALHHVPGLDSTRWPGIYMRHEATRPAYLPEHAARKCRCTPFWKGRFKSEWGPTFCDRAEAQSWLTGVRTGTPVVEERAAAGRTLGSLGQEWLQGVRAGTIQRRRGMPQPYSATTVKPYARDFKSTLAEFHERPAAEIDESEWQEFFDELRDRALSYSRAANLKAVASAIYAYASYRTRRRADGGHDESAARGRPGGEHRPPARAGGERRGGEATARRARRQGPGSVRQRLLCRLAPHRHRPTRLVRRRARGRKPGYWLRVRPMEEGGPGKVGTGRSVPIAEPLRSILLATFIRQGRPTAGRVCEVSVMSGKLGTRVRKAWEGAGLAPIGSHECRHTYCSFLVAANYDLAKVMRYMGHTQLSTTQRYIHVIEEHMAQADEATALNAYFGAWEAQSD